MRVKSVLGAALVMALATVGACIIRGGDKVDTNKVQIDFKEVDWFASRAEAAYQNDDAIRQAFPDTIHIGVLPHIDVKYFLESDAQNRRQIISVRGTSNLQNGLLDAEYVQSRENELGIYAHKGFLESTDAVYSDLKKRLNKDYDTYVTGHSLGAAIATLLMMHMQVDGYKLVKSYNFGQPKVTNSQGLKRYENLPVVRVVNAEDPVPLVPPITLISSVHGAYEHLGEEIVLLKKHYFSFLDRHDAERVSLGSFWKNLGHEKLDDHRMANYRASIADKFKLAMQIDYGERERYAE